MDSASMPIPYLVEDGNQLQHSRVRMTCCASMRHTIRAERPERSRSAKCRTSRRRMMATYYPDQLDSYFAFGVASGIMRRGRDGRGGVLHGGCCGCNAKYPDGRWSPFLANHDQPRVMTVLGDPAKARVAASAMLMLPGMPFVYYGEEIGMVGAKPDELIRTPMQWSAAPNGGFTTGTPWEPLQPDWKTNNVAAQDSSRQSLLNHYRKLIHLRNASPALSRGPLTLVQTDDTTGTIAAWLRSSRDEAFLIVVNFGPLSGTASNAGAAAARAARRDQKIYRIGLRRPE